MNPQEPPQSPPASTLHASQPPSDPTKGSRSLAIALVVSAIFLVAAAGIVTWLFVVRNQSPQAVQNIPTDDVKNVKNVSVEPPAELPAAYTKSDQSTATATRTYYYDTATNCGFTTGVIAAPTDKTIQNAAIELITTGQAQGITIAAQTEGDSLTLKDAASGKDYTFDTITLNQDVKVEGVAFTKQHNVVGYKQFGGKVALVSFSCKAEEWDAKKAELAGVAQTFKIKTER